MRFLLNWPLTIAAIAVVALALFVDIPRLRHRWGWLVLVRHLVLGALILGVALRPVIGADPIEKSQIRADVVFMVDRTSSMGALDWDGGKPRMNGVAADVAEIVARLDGARFALVVFDNDARLEVPPTTDGMAVVTAVRTLGWREVENGSGSDITVGVPLVAKVLQDAQQRDPQGARLLYYAGDGEQTSAAVPGSMAPLASLVTGGYVMGYGTTAGAQMQRSPADPGVVQYQGKPGISKADPVALEKLAQQFGGHFSLREKPGSAPLPGTSLPRQTDTEFRLLSSGELYWMLAIGGYLLIVAEIALAAQRWRRARKEARAC